MSLFAKTCFRCEEDRTRRSFEGVPTCVACELQLKVDRKDLRRCPIDSNTMKKDIVHSILIDRCEKCGGVWLDGRDLEEAFKLYRFLAKFSLIPMAIPAAILLYLKIKASGADGDISAYTLTVGLIVLGLMYGRYESFSSRAKAINELIIKVKSDDSANVKKNRK
jgi:hypothetical protein